MYVLVYISMKNKLRKKSRSVKMWQVLYVTSIICDKYYMWQVLYVEMEARQWLDKHFFLSLLLLNHWRTSLLWYTVFLFLSLETLHLIASYSWVSNTLWPLERLLNTSTGRLDASASPVFPFFLFKHQFDTRSKPLFVIMRPVSACGGVLKPAWIIWMKWPQLCSFWG